MDIYNTLFLGKVKKTVFCGKNCIFFSIFGAFQQV